MNTSTYHFPQVQVRAVRMGLKRQHEHASQWATISMIAAKIGCTAETLRDGACQSERNQAQRRDPIRRVQARMMATDWVYRWTGAIRCNFNDDARSLP